MQESALKVVLYKSQPQPPPLTLTLTESVRLETWHDSSLTPSLPPSLLTLTESVGLTVARSHRLQSQAQPHPHPQCHPHSSVLSLTAYPPPKRLAYRCTKSPPKAE